MRGVTELIVAMMASCLKEGARRYGLRFQCLDRCIGRTLCGNDRGYCCLHGHRDYRHLFMLIGGDRQDAAIVTRDSPWNREGEVDRVSVA